MSVKKFKDIVLTPPGKRKTGSPWVIYFVYAPSGNYVIKGQSDVVSDYVTKKFPKSFFRVSVWKNGKEKTSFWDTPWDLPMSISYSKRENPMTGRDMWRVDFGRPSDKVREELWFRRMPNRWIDIFDEVLEYVEAQNNSYSIS